ncbi:MAG: hypothetical protein V4596_11265 [Bdellovibrionota bacterium]
MKNILVETVENTLKSSTHKFNGLEDFSEQVLIDYILTLSKSSIILDYTKIKETKEELLMEITEITKKKMYGFYDINEYKEFLTKKNC